MSLQFEVVLQVYELQIDSMNAHSHEYAHTGILSIQTQQSALIASRQQLCVLPVQHFLADFHRHEGRLFLSF